FRRRDKRPETEWGGCMAGDDQRVNGDQLPLSEPASWQADEESAISAEAFRQSFGEDIRQTLNLDTWRVGSDLTHEYGRIVKEVHEAVERETVLEKRIRAEVFPRLKSRPGAPKNAGKHEADFIVIEKIQREFLFPGG